MLMCVESLKTPPASSSNHTPIIQDGSFVNDVPAKPKNDKKKGKANKVQDARIGRGMVS